MSSLFGIFNRSDQPISQEYMLAMKKATHWWEVEGEEKIEAPGLFIGKAEFAATPRVADKLTFAQVPINILADVRLDNRVELDRKLNIPPSAQYSDTDYIRKAYEVYGKSCVDHLIGAFAFIIHDPQNKIIFCARDQMGVKPLHYYFDHTQLVVGTEKKSILCLPFVNKHPNWNNIVHEMMNYRKKEEDTEYRHIKRLPAASCLTFNESGDLSVRRYWTLDTTSKTIYQNERDYIDHFIEHVNRAVSDRMRNVKNIGSHLSGGLDSSGITGVAAAIAKKQGRELHAFSYTVPKDKEDKELPFENENPFVMDQVKHSGIIHHHRVEQPIYLTRREVIEAEMRKLDGFSASNNLATEYEIHHKAREMDVDVILSGFPGDECVTSFVRPYYLEYLEEGRWVKYFTSRHRGTYSFKKLLGPFLLKLSGYFGGPLNPENAAVLYQKLRLKNRTPVQFDLENNLFSPQYLEESADLVAAFSPSIESQYLYGFPLNLREYQRNHICRRHTSARIESEIMSGLDFKVEYRYPYADIRLVQYVCSLPMEQKIIPGGPGGRKEQSRLIYRRGMKDYVPASILARDNKQGSLKPMMRFYRRNTNITIKEMYLELEANGHLTFLNHDKIKPLLDEGLLAPMLGRYLCLGELARQGKMEF